MICLPDYRGIHLYAAADECNHNLLEHNQPGLSNGMFGPLSAVSSSFYARAHAAAGAVA